MAVVRSTYAFHQRPFSVSHVPLVIFPAVHAPHLVPRTEHLRATSAVVDAVSLGDEVGVSILVIPDRAGVRYPLVVFGLIAHERTVGVKDTEAHISRAAKAPALSHEDIYKAVEKALSNKAAMVPKLAPNTRYCVVLVDTMEQLEPSDDNYWSAFDLSAFDAVAVARIEGNSPTALGFVKGKIGCNLKVQESMLQFRPLILGDAV